MRLGFLRGGGEFHVRGEQRQLRAVPVGADPATNVDAHAAPDAPANIHAHAKTDPYAYAVAVAAPHASADARA